MSARSLQTLRRYDLAELYPGSPAEACSRLHVEALHDPRPDLLFALAELHFIRGQKAESSRCPDAAVFYYLSAGDAYHYLFDRYPPGEPGRLQLASAGNHPPPSRA